jgi:oligopeptide/dipeptide ABC transporter ATP-binding protein
VKQGFGRPRGMVRAVEDVSLAVPAGQTLALVGESGCGKTTIARMVLLLERPSAGRIEFAGQDLAGLSGPDLKKMRRRMQAVFQDPYASLNPRLRVRTIIAEPLLEHHRLDRAALHRRVAELLDIVGLPAAAAGLYPHEFSGGQRQRIAIARALALQPEMIVLDEPISALDVSIRAQVLNLLMDIQEQFGLTYLVIAHDLALVEHLSTEVAVIYLGRVMERGPTEAVFGAPAHPYTQALLAAVGRPDPDFLPTVEIGAAEPASALDPPPGCRFQDRCPLVMPICRSISPPEVALGDAHFASCHKLTAGPDD